MRLRTKVSIVWDAVVVSLLGIAVVAAYLYYDSATLVTYGPDYVYGVWGLGLLFAVVIFLGVGVGLRPQTLFGRR